MLKYTLFLEIELFYLLQSLSEWISTEKAMKQAINWNLFTHKNDPGTCVIQLKWNRFITSNQSDDKK